MKKEIFKIGDKAQFKVRTLSSDLAWVDCIIGKKELEEIKTGVGFFDYRKPPKT